MALRTCLDGQIFLDVQTGTEPCVICLHGWGRDRTDFEPLAHHSDHRLISIDLAGFGTSPEPEPGWGAKEYAEQIERVLKEIDIEEAIVVGHSFGGRVAINLAAYYPKRVSALVLCGVPVKPRESTSKPKLQYRLARAANALGLFSDARMEKMRRRYGSADYVNATKVMRSVLVKVVSEDYTPELLTLTQPVSMLWGSQDTAASAELVSYIESVAPKIAEVNIIEGAGHDVHLSHTAELASLISLAAQRRRPQTEPAVPPAQQPTAKPAQPAQQPTAEPEWPAQRPTTDGE